MFTRGALARRGVRLLLIAALTIAALSSCQVASLLFGVTIDQRIRDFSSGYVNGDYPTLYKNFSTNTQDRNAMKAGTSYWSNTPFASTDGPQAINNYNVSGSTVTGTFSNSNATFDFTMQMQESGMDWYILSLTLSAPSGSSSGSYQIKRID